MLGHTTDCILFLALVVVVYWLFPLRKQNYVLLALDSRVLDLGSVSGSPGVSPSSSICNQKHLLASMCLQ
jgi:hypothetical protein